MLVSFCVATQLDGGKSLFFERVLVANWGNRKLRHSIVDNQSLLQCCKSVVELDSEIFESHSENFPVTSFLIVCTTSPLSRGKFQQEGQMKVATLSLIHYAKFS